MARFIGLEAYESKKAGVDFPFGPLQAAPEWPASISLDAGVERLREVHAHGAVGVLGPKVRPTPGGHKSISALDRPDA